MNKLCCCWRYHCYTRLLKPLLFLSPMNSFPVTSHIPTLRVGLPHTLQIQRIQRIERIEIQRNSIVSLQRVFAHNAWCPCPQACVDSYNKSLKKHASERVQNTTVDVFLNSAHCSLRALLQNMIKCAIQVPFSQLIVQSRDDDYCHPSQYNRMESIVQKTKYSLALWHALVHHTGTHTRTGTHARTGTYAGPRSHTGTTPSHTYRHTDALTRVHRLTGPQAQGHMSTRAHEHTSTRAHEHTSTRAHEHTSTRAHEHTSTRAHEHTSTRAHEHTNTRTHEHTSTRTHEHTSTRAHEHTSTRTHEHTSTRAHEHTNTRAHEHTSTRTHEHTNTRTHEHTNTQAHRHTSTVAHEHTRTLARGYTGRRVYGLTGTYVHRYTGIQARRHK